MPVNKPQKRQLIRHLFEEDEDGFLHVCKGDGTIYRRQDAPTVFEYNGAIYIINTDALDTLVPMRIDCSDSSVFI